MLEDDLEAIKKMNRSLANMKILFGAFLIAVFLIAYQLITNIHLEVGILWISLVIGVGILAWGLIDIIFVD